MKKLVSFISILALTATTASMTTAVFATTQKKSVTTKKVAATKKTAKKTTAKKAATKKGKTYGSSNGFTTKTVTKKVNGKTVKQKVKTAKIVTRKPNGKIVTRTITAPIQTKAKAKVTKTILTSKQLSKLKIKLPVTSQPTKTDTSAMKVIQSPPNAKWISAMGFGAVLPKKPAYYYFPKNPNIPQILYMTPFKGPNYIDNNTWVQRQGSSRVIAWTKQIIHYMDTMYNVDYRTYNKKKYINQTDMFFVTDDNKHPTTVTDTNYIDAIKRFFMPKTYWTMDDGIKRPILGFLKYWSDNIKNKQIIIKADFVTDPSLMYCSKCYGNDGGMIVRGQLNFTVQHCKDMNWLGKFNNYFRNIKIGKKYSCVVDVEIEYMSGLNTGWTYLPGYLTNENAITKVTEVK